MHHQIHCTSADQTARLGHLLGQFAPAGMVFRLEGDLGSGKTCLVKGMAAGLGVSPEIDITSPTYALIHEYPARQRFFHIDLYRLSGTPDMEAIGLWDIFDGRSVAAVEWAEKLADDQWPSDSIRIVFTVDANDTRQIRLIGGGLAATNLIREVVAELDP